MKHAAGGIPSTYAYIHRCLLRADIVSSFPRMHDDYCTDQRRASSEGREQWCVLMRRSGEVVFPVAVDPNMFLICGGRSPICHHLPAIFKVAGTLHCVFSQLKALFMLEIAGTQSSD